MPNPWLAAFGLAFLVVGTPRSSSDLLPAVGSARVAEHTPSATHAGFCLPSHICAVKFLPLTEGDIATGIDDEELSEIVADRFVYWLDDPAAHMVAAFYGVPHVPGDR